MFAIIAASGKQFRVSEGDRILVDRVPAGVGAIVRLDSVLLLSGDGQPVVGTPYVPGARVEATVLAHRAGNKIIVFKYKPKKRQRSKAGHRQLLTELKIGAIHRPGPEPAGKQAAGEAAPGPASRDRKRTSGRPAGKE